MNKVTTLLIPEELRRQVRKVCIDLNISMSEFARQALSEKLERTLSAEEKNDTKTSS